MVLCAEPPATCLQNNPTLDAFIECAPQTIVYTAENPEEKATWTSDPGVVLDASYLFRGIILNRPLDLRDMTFAQVLYVPAATQRVSTYVFLCHGNLLECISRLMRVHTISPCPSCFTKSHHISS